MRFQILGPVEIDTARGASLRRRRDRCLLGLLLINLNRVITVDRLSELLWDGSPPDSARPAIHISVSRVRAALTNLPDPPAAELTKTGDGYRLRADPDSVDLFRFRALRDRAGRSDVPLLRAEQLREALDLWRGPPLEDAASDWLRRVHCAGLVEEHLAATEDLFAASLELRREREVLPELARMAGTYPGRESLAGLHMRALYLAGRTKDALDAYEHVRSYLADGFGIDPGPALRALRQAILRDEVPLPASSDTTGPASPPAVAGTPGKPSGGPSVPRQLPAGAVDFSGRADYLRAIDDVRPAAGRATVAGVILIHGPAGVGKTALAVHAGHRLADGYPDGQLFFDLHGFSESHRPIKPADALGRLLPVVGAADSNLPAQLDDRASLFRSQLAGRRLLLVLDNAASETQVIPLLPGTPDCLVLITSRRHLGGLDASRRVALEPLSLPEAVGLLTAAAGERRLRGEPLRVLAEIAELCDQLPLAIRIAAARLAAHPAWRAADLAVRLRCQEQRLAELAIGSRSVASALELSYRRLTAAQQRAYRLLSLFPGRELDRDAAAALIGVSRPQAELLLEQLLGEHLLVERAHGRYAFQQLVAIHARQVAADRAANPLARIARQRVDSAYE